MVRPQPGDAPWATGHNAVLRAIKSEPALNGQRVTVLGKINRQTGRIPVQLDFCTPPREMTVSVVGLEDCLTVSVIVSQSLSD